jgi:hypothetical protein
MNLNNYNLSQLRALLANDNSLSDVDRKRIQTEICYRQNEQGLTRVVHKAA